MRGSRIPECIWFQPRIFFFFFFFPRKKPGNNSKYNELNKEVIQSTSHADHNAQFNWKRTAVTVCRTTNTKGKELHPQNNIFSIKISVTSKMHSHQCKFEEENRNLISKCLTLIKKKKKSLTTVYEMDNQIQRVKYSYLTTEIKVHGCRWQS